MFIYVDPIRPTDLLFDDLASAYNQLHLGRSVESLVNFLSTGFTRLAQGIVGRCGDPVIFDMEHSETKRCNDIAGGEYWQEHLIAADCDQRERIERIAQGYALQLRRWFEWVLPYAIREKYEDEQPKYHLIFGSRHPDAIELMNRAMVTARRKFVERSFVDGMLFPNQPQEEVVDERTLDESVVKAASATGPTDWKMLRVKTTLSEPCLYTDSEINRAIKRLIKAGRLKSGATGNKIENAARVWV